MYLSSIKFVLGPGTLELTSAEELCNWGWQRRDVSVSELINTNEKGNLKY